MFQRSRRSCCIAFVTQKLPCASEPKNPNKRKTSRFHSRASCADRVAPRRTDSATFVETSGGDDDSGLQRAMRRAGVLASETDFEQSEAVVVPVDVHLCSSQQTGEPNDRHCRNRRRILHFAPDVSSKAREKLHLFVANKPTKRQPTCIRMTSGDATQNINR